MTILYALVARQNVVLAEYTFTSGNFPTITRVLLGKIPPEDGKMSYVYDQYVFHYVVEKGLTFLCMADESFKRRVPFAFLDDVKERWFATYGDSGRKSMDAAQETPDQILLRLARQMEDVTRGINEIVTREASIT